MRPVEKEIVTEPGPCSTKQAMPIMGHDELERTYVVPGDTDLAF